MFDNNQAGMGYNPLAGNLRRQQVPQGPAMGMSGMWPGAYMPSGYPQDRQGTSNMWIPVKNLDEARNAFVQPGEQKWFMVDDQMMFAMKAVSSAGVMDFQAFDFAPHVETQVQQTTTQQPAQPNVLEEYAEMATHYKAEYKELADVFYGMATSEMGHMKNLHGWVVRLIDKEKKDGTRNVPQGMLDVWAWKHKKMITRFNEAEIKLQNYQKL